ncbi:hypothetical protein V1290_003223 [Bradyrhizobium sp. AZCC 1578]
MRRRQLQRRDTAQEVLEYLELRALERIAEQVGQLAQLQPGILRGAIGDFLAVAARRLDDIGRCLGNCHGVRLAPKKLGRLTGP